MNLKNKKKRLLAISALVSTLAIENFDIMDKIVEITPKVYALGDDENNSTTGVTIGAVERAINNYQELFTAYEKRTEIINQLAIQFSTIYGISVDDCSKIITENIEYIFEYNNPIEILDNIIQIEISNGYYAVEDNKQNLFGTGTGNITYVNEFKNTEAGKIYKEYTDMYGVDYNFALALAKQESNLDHENHLPGTDYFNGFAYGISQIENSLIGSRFEAFNFNTGQNEIIEIVKDYPSAREDGITYLSVMNYADNVRIGVAKLQSKLINYNYNIFMALQAYNYGDGAFRLALDAYSKETGLSTSEIINNKTDFGWLKYVKDLNTNPKKYIPNWEYESYGHGEYINGVSQYITNPILKFKTINNEILYISAKDQTTVKMSNETFIELNNIVKTIKEIQTSSMNPYSTNSKTKVRKR